MANIKWRWVDKFENWAHLQYYMGRKNGAVINVSKKGKKYNFSVERVKDDFCFNSGWGTYPNENYQKMLNELPDMIFNIDDDALQFIEKWVDENIPKLKK